MNIGIITGASSGLGVVYLKSVVKLYPNLDEIWIIARRKERLESLKEEYKNVIIRPIALDLSLNESYTELESLLKEVKPNIEILVNNAGFERTGSLKTMSSKDILSTIDLNVKGSTMINHLCLSYMKKGSVGIMTGSVSSFCPVPYQAVYSSSKVYVRFLSRAIREEVKRKGINFLVMCPGNMDTEMNPKGGDSQSPMVDKLPFLDMNKITLKSIKKAKKGKAIYTPGMFYKNYRLFSKILPSSFMIKIVKKSYKHLEDKDENR